ncbi:MAG: hypothetical protein WAJ99_20210, partial [Candidatus Sulfotelmatobacter sp.]
SRSRRLAGGLPVFQSGGGDLIQKDRHLAKEAATEELIEAGSHLLDRFATRTSNLKAREVACSLLTSNGPLVTPRILLKAAAAISRKGNATS